MGIKSSDIEWLTPPPGGSAAAVTLAALTDVTITGPADLDLLQYDTATSQWVDRSADEAGLVDKTSAQTVGGAKKFTDDLTFDTTKGLKWEDEPAADVIRITPDALSVIGVMFRTGLRSGLAITDQNLLYLGGSVGVEIGMGDDLGATKASFLNASIAEVASVDSTGAASFYGADMQSQKITSVLDPTADQDAATKKYADDTFAPIADGVTGGNSHDHSGGDGAQIDHGGLGGLADDDHTQYMLKSLLTEQGDVIYASAASTPAALVHGTAGQVLKSGGHGANPSWVDTSGILEASTHLFMRHLADNNYYVGANAMAALTTGDYNIAIGDEALRYNATGSYNVCIGEDAGAGAAGQSYGRCVYVGYQAGYKTTTGASLSNVAIGYQAGYSLTSGGSNVAIGPGTLMYTQTGIYNMCLGSSAGLGVVNKSFSYCTYIGANAGRSTTEGSLYNVAIGDSAMYNNTTGAGNAVIGREAVYYNQTGIANTAVGYNAGRGATGNSYSNNTIIGYQAGYNLTTGGNNILVGYKAGDVLTTGASNIIIGYDIDPPANNSASILEIGGIIKGSIAATKFVSLFAPSSAPTIPANSFAALYLDEAGHNLKVVVKYSDGTDKTATIAFD